MTSVGSTNFISGGFNADNSDGNFEDFPVVLLKGISLGIFEITMLVLADYYKHGENSGCMEGTSLGVSNISIKVSMKQL